MSESWPILRQDEAIPFGFCQCGCGNRTAIIYQTNAARGDVKGQPRRFLVGHAGRRSVEDRFWEKVQKTDSCWLWTATISSNGYGQFYKVAERPNAFAAHRIAYELLVGPIPDGLSLDHLCRVRHCVNPAHLEPVTHPENVQRGANARLTAEDVEEIRRLVAQGKTNVAVADMYGVSDTRVSYIARGLSWANTFVASVGDV